MRRFNEKGFTLIELMVVIAILGIGAAVAIIPYIRHLKDARNEFAETTVNSIFQTLNTCDVVQCDTKMDIDTTNGEKIFSCVNCQIPQDNNKIWLIVGGEYQIEISDNPVKSIEGVKINGFHSKGDKIYCLSALPKHIVNYQGDSLDFSMCN